MSWRKEPAESAEAMTPSAGVVDSLRGSASSTLFSVQSQVSVLRLGHWQEALGVLVGVDRDAGVIAFRSFKITVPPRELEHLQDLEAFTGRRVGILRTDEPRRPLLLRLVEKLDAEEVNR